MEYYHNPGKALEIEVAGERYLRHGIRTHFVEVGEDYLDLFRRYVVPVSYTHLDVYKRQGSAPPPGRR